VNNDRKGRQKTIKNNCINTIIWETTPRKSVFLPIKKIAVAFLLTRLRKINADMNRINTKSGVYQKD
jgi:hypothetical protein